MRAAAPPVPRKLAVAPSLSPDLRTGAPTARHALLLNPFYAKDPHASFGKHVLTPTLALTSIAGATPDGWTVRPEDYARRVDVFHRNGIQVNGSFVLGFDFDGPDVFERTCSWIEAARLECATFHILTPYPGTPLFKTMKAQGRLLHEDWSLYDTSHVVFRPERMGVDELAEGYSYCYRRLFSHGSISKRRPVHAGAVLPYLAMTYLYKRSNRFWPLLIESALTRRAWHPLVGIARRRNVRQRGRFADHGIPAFAAPIAPGV